MLRTVAGAIPHYKIDTSTTPLSVMFVTKGTVKEMNPDQNTLVVRTAKAKKSKPSFHQVPESTRRNYK
jgi:hypothetical protein